jgi:hypothetical protein
LVFLQGSDLASLLAAAVLELTPQESILKKALKNPGFGLFAAHARLGISKQHPRMQLPTMHC